MIDKARAMHILEYIISMTYKIFVPHTESITSNECIQKVTVHYEHRLSHCKMNHCPNLTTWLFLDKISIVCVSKTKSNKWKSITPYLTSHPYGQTIIWCSHTHFSWKPATDMSVMSSPWNLHISMWLSSEYKAPQHFGSAYWNFLLLACGPVACNCLGLVNNQAQ